ncbi:GNAT family N-acetyltransferase [Intrasporangium sp. YIM S08009]|uniref:GNAT family N-acetyltransferase n=1 Tax=Intrasporangium zincisolvens TaxID=3080018 RepID=UPI002B05E2E8|nr:GNAT family N-acetyltransferase [Intrasporangium sp. YIM S08009]
MAVPLMRTERLVLRGWTEGDRRPFAELNADPEVMEHLPTRLAPAESDAFADRIERHFEEHGFGLWAVEARGEFVGYTGLSVPRFHAHWMEGREQPIVEVGWRLRRDAWGLGYATEAAMACVGHAFEVLGRSEVVSFTVRGNRRSRAVMERLGMHPIAEYDHPVDGHVGVPSVCYLLRGSAPVTVPGA